MQRFIPLFLLSSPIDSFSYTAHTFLQAAPASLSQYRNHQLTSLTATVDKSEDERKMDSARSRYKTDINALNQLLDSNEEQKLEEMKRLIRDIQEVRRTSPEVALPRKVREALAEYHHAETKYGSDSREAKIAYEYFVDISHARDLHPDRHQEDEGGKEDVHSSMVLEEALNAIHVLEELKEIAFVEKTILDRFGTTDFEIGEGFLEREIGREDDDTYGLWV